MYVSYSNLEILEAMEKSLSVKDWDEYLLLQEEADIRGI